MRLRFGRDVFSLENARALVGRSRSCEIRLREDTVSRLHAAFVWKGETLVVEDLGSSNGTYVNGQRLAAPQEIGPGDTIAFGALRGNIEPSDAPLPPVDRDRSQDATYDYTVGVVAGAAAGLGWRVLAVLTDLVLFVSGLAIPLAPLLATLLAERYLLAPGVSGPGLETKGLIAGGCGALCVLYGWYYVIHGWARRGGTPGLRLLGLRLLDWRARIPIGYSRAWLRLAALLVTALSLGLGFLTAAFRRDGKTLHDLLAGTLVVHRVRPAARSRRTSSTGQPAVQA